VQTFKTVSMGIKLETPESTGNRSPLQRINRADVETSASSQLFDVFI